jgi:hypothetical protein
MINPAHEVRHVVKIEVHAPLEPPMTEECDDDRDHLMEIHETLESLDLDEEQLYEYDDFRKLCFDLCSDCYRKYIQDPLGAEASLQVGFSHN